MLFFFRGEGGGGYTIFANTLNLFVYIGVLRPSQLNGVMSNAVGITSQRAYDVYTASHQRQLYRRKCDVV